MKHFLIAFFLFVCLSSFGQDTIRTVRTTRGPTYRSAQIDCFLEGHKTQAEIMSLFDPSEISMESTTSDGRMRIELAVKDSTHVVLKYFKRKAQLQLNGELYPHNQIPGIEHRKISRLIYHDNSSLQLPDILEIVLYGEEFVSREKTRYHGAPKPLLYFDVNGEIVGKEQFQRLHENGARVNEIIRGKEAVNKYGDEKYSGGVGIVIVK